MLRTLPDGCAGLVYVDPPFNTGGARTGLHTSATAGCRRRRASGSRGVATASERADGPALSTIVSTTTSDGCARGSCETRRILAPHGSLYFHIDPRESHYCKVLLDEIFGRECFLNEVVWAYDYGARTTRRWPAKHDVILVYVRDPRLLSLRRVARSTREPYMAPRLQTPERAARGKLPTDVWWHTIVPTSSRERTGYPTQKPLGIAAPDRGRVVASRGARGRLVRGQRHHRRGRRRAGPAVPARRRSGSGDRGDAHAPRRRARPAVINAVMR